MRNHEQTLIITTQTSVPHCHCADAIRFIGSPLALDRDVFSRTSKDGPRAGKTPPKPGGLSSHGRWIFVLAFLAKVLIPPLESLQLGRGINLGDPCCLVCWSDKNTNQQKCRPHEVGKGQICGPEKVISKTHDQRYPRQPIPHGPRVPRPETIGFRSSLVEVSEEGIREMHTLSLRSSLSQ
ncbi:hypothetical protein DSO57_1039523 [Entomophthora muscae]|uniref:Uncharacterized protein n=1 Tax=Entomophthora muscae TaxID=34485 RepID=A0ACC2T984_9FUNG|nr:hypothetical protein DSO57_1039523 [Entomophthora muscae]